MENVKYAGFLKRFLALILDQLLLQFVTSLILLPFWIIFGLSFLSFEEGIQGESIKSIGYLQSNGDEFSYFAASAFILVMLILSVISTVIQWLYYALMESSSKRATLGKMALGLSVTNESGEKISFGKASGRFFAKIISAIIFYVGFILAAFTEKKQALHDMIAGCVVIEKE